MWCDHSPSPARSQHVQRDEIPLITARIAALVGDHPGEAAAERRDNEPQLQVPFGDHDSSFASRARTPTCWASTGTRVRGEQARGRPWRPGWC